MASAPEVMMVLGTYSFALSSSAYQELTRSTGFTWAEQPLIGGRPVLQFTGLETETIAIRGVIYPTFRGGLGQVDTMRAQAAKAKPLNLVSGTGAYLGKWVIEKVGEGFQTFFANGVPKKIEFDISLKRYA